MLFPSNIDDRIPSDHPARLVNQVEYQTYYHYLGINGNIPFDRFMDFMIFELGKSDSVIQDEHIFRRQVDYYQRKDVDFIIPISQLNEF